MATPTGDRADRARRFHARERRRVKQDQKAFDNAGLFATPFDFGSTLLGQDSPNSLQLPANCKIAISSSVALNFDDVFIGDDLETWGQRLGFPVGGIVKFDTQFQKNRTILITRGDVAVAAVLEIYFWGPKSQIIKFGDCVFT